ncbi:iron chelate uptake ABC transporter family permease subunit [Gulosibacter sp. 10]|uniref:FecCD family ABC transporter permease n=1 Tax=Gulosibacter sp. 10 TaxID=1255570 RepID=UPI00097F1F6C|nr:iron chelate uptake ABC transporter family permease subunit [Gulosibacter sp. 10]SJM67511.1 ABC-type Fe3+-siderophore transport system, permease 2 component [Gulosibacter sp. 10]
MTETKTPSWPSAVRPLRLGRFSARIEIRAVCWTAAAAIAAIALGLYAVTVGSSTLGLPDLLDALLGRADERATRTLLGWRMPRVVFALLAGAALAVSGAVFQSITRNPLGSPDIIGFSTGAYTGALIVSIFAAGSALGTSIGALVGGILTGVAVYLLAYSRGVSGMRIIVVGIGVSLFLGAFNTWLLTTLKVEQAISAASWGAGDLDDIGWIHTVPLLIGVCIGVPVLLWLSADMRMLEMGDDSGRGLGVRAEPVRMWLLLTAIALVALVTAAAGPIAFVALAAPQLAMRITGTAGVRILPSAAFGALLLVASDLVARTIIAPERLPVGVVTLCVGGAYLVWLLASFGRKTR